MKRKANLYSAMCDDAIIRQAIHNAAIGKTRYPHVKKILCNEEFYVKEIRKMLEDGTYAPHPYQKATIREGTGKKEREISKPKFYPDQVIHWCIYLVLKPWLFRKFYVFNCGSIPGRGVHYGKKYVQKWVQTDRKNTKYYLKLDVRKFYQSIQPDKLMPKLRRIIKDERFLRLNEQILSMEPGLPIGMLLSQVYANFFLTDLDFWIKQELGVKYYMRYMDDMVLFGRNKKELHRIRRLIAERLAKDGLELKANWQVCKFNNEPLDFMGFRFYRDRITIRKRIMIAISRCERKAGKAGRSVSFHRAAAAISYLGWIKCTDSHELFEKWIKPYLHIRILKNVIRRTENEKLQKQFQRQTCRLGQGIQQKLCVS